MNFRVPICLPIYAFLSLTGLSAQSVSLDLITVPTTVTPQSLVVGDFNHDGKPDIAVSGTVAAGSGAVEILLGNGDGTFRSTAVIAVGAHASRIVTADFNKDGRLDLAVAVGDGGQVVVLLGNGDGSFQAPADSGAKSPGGQLASAGVPGLAVGDINGDGKVDLVLGPYTFASSSSVSVMAGNGDGTFQRPISTAIADRLDSARTAVADFNGDGKADVIINAMTRGLLPEIALLLGSADGSLVVSLASTQYSTSNSLPAVVVQDVNGNGKPDIIMARGGFPTLVFLDGSLQPISSSASFPLIFGSAPSIATADIDGDGHPDLVLTDPIGNLYVLFGAGDGTFRALPPSSPSAIYTDASTSGSQTFSDIYSSLTTADFRGVGRPDVVVALAGKSVSLLKNGSGASPVVTPAGVANVASLAVAPGVPGSLMAVFGSGLAYGSGAAQNNPAAFTLAPSANFGLTIQVNGMDAPLLYTSPGQANIQIPWELAGQTQATFVTTRNGFSQTITIPIVPYAPGLFAAGGQGTGQAAAVINGTASVAAPVGAFAGSRPIHHGEYLELFGTGLGAVYPSGWIVTGQFTPQICCYLTNAEQPYLTPTRPLVTVGGESATVQFSGLAPYMLGVFQINILIPDGAPAGNAVPVVLSIGGVPSNTVMIAVQ